MTSHFAYLFHMRGGAAAGQRTSCGFEPLKVPLFKDFQTLVFLNFKRFSGNESLQIHSFLPFPDFAHDAKALCCRAVSLVACITHKWGATAK